MQTSAQSTTGKRLSSVKNLPELYPHADLTEGGIRWWIFNGKETGFNRCVVRIGGKVLIDLDKFEALLEE